MDDEIGDLGPNFSLGLTQEIMNESSRLPPRGKKKTSPKKVVVLRSSNRIRDIQNMSNRGETRTSIPVQPRQPSVRGSGKGQVSGPAKGGKKPTQKPPSLIGPFQPLSVPSTERVKCFLKLMERGV